MKTKIVTFLILGVVLILLILFSGTSNQVLAKDAKGELSGIEFDLTKDPVARQRILNIYSLVKEAEGGNKDALKILELWSKEADVLPFKSGLGKAWSNATQINLEDWRNRKGENSYLPRQDSAPRLQAAAIGLVPYRNPAPAFSRNLLLTRDFGIPIQTEPDICVNPQNPNNVVMGAIDYGLPSTAVYVSLDAGQTWQGPYRVPLSEETVVMADPVLACGKSGKIYHNFMSLGVKTHTLGVFLVDVVYSDIAVSVSEDGGFTWNQPSVVSTSDFGIDVLLLQVENEIIEIPVLTISFLDKNWITSGPHPDDPTKEMVYASFTKFTDYIYIAQPLPGLILLIPIQWTSEIEVFRSEDGVNWEKTKIMDPVPGIVDLEELIVTGSFDEVRARSVQGSQLGVDDDGTVFASWYDSTKDGVSRGKAKIYTVFSKDAGRTWQGPTLVAEVLEVPWRSRAVPFRNNNLPQMAIGAQEEVYLVYPGRTPDKPEDDGDIYFSYGRIQGGKLIFSKPKKVNQDNTTKLQFFPTIAVDENNTLHVMWGDTRNDTYGIKYDIYYTKSDDNGKTWGFELPELAIKEPDTRVTDFPSNPNRGFPGGRFIGDYFSIDAVGDYVFMVWADTRLGEYGPINQKIGFARNKAIPSPEIFLNPGRGSSGQEVNIQAFNFQPDMMLFVKVGGNIIAGGKTNLDGQLQFKVFMPFSASEGVQDVVVFDESGNTAVASFYVDFGFSDLQDATEQVGNVQQAAQSVEQSVNDINSKINLIMITFGVLMAVVVVSTLIVLIKYKTR